MSELASLRDKHKRALFWARDYRTSNRTTAAKLISEVAPSIRRKFATEKAWYASLPKLTTDGRPNPYADDTGEDTAYDMRKNAA